MQKADTEYLAREIAALRIAVGEVSTRDFVRSELSRLAEELDESAERRLRLDRKDRQKDTRRASKAAAALEQPASDVDGADEPKAYDDQAAPRSGGRRGH